MPNDRSDSGSSLSPTAKYYARRVAALAALTLIAVVLAVNSGSCESEPETAAPAVFDPHYVVNPYTAYDHERVMTEAAELEASYPGLIETRVIGSSVEGRELVALKVGYGDKTIIFNGAIHGCESFTTNFLMHLIDRYAYGYATDAEYEGYSYRELLDKVSFIIVPMLNPDGVNIAQNGPDAAADPASIRTMDMTGTGYYAWKANADGVDINRNFPYNWSRFNYVLWPALRYYVGPYANSEPETQAMVSLLESEDFCLLADFHSYGETLYWTDNLSEQYYDEHRELAELIMSGVGYGDAGIEDVDEFAGYLSNYARGVYGVFSATVELTPYFGYPVSEFDAATERVYPIGLIMADYAIENDLKGTKGDIPQPEEAQADASA